MDEYVPIDNYTVHVGTKQATFDLSGNKLYGDPGITTTAVTGTMPYGGPLPGYGYDHDTGGVNFGTTVGYGYSGANHSVTVTIQVDTSKLGLSTGSHDVYVDLNAESSSKKHTFDSGTKTLTIKSADTGGGGDGAAPGLPPSPGDGTVKKVYTRYTVVTITPGEPAEVDLPEGAPIQAVKIGTKKTVFDPTISVAEHTGKPQDVDDPRRTVKSYVSITSTISDDDLESMELEFSVPRDWLEENGLEPENIVMMHWHDDEWKDLDTEIVSEDGEIAYRASTGELSVFAIGVVEKVAATPTPTPEATHPRTNRDTDTHTGAGRNRRTHTHRYTGPNRPHGISRTHGHGLPNQEEDLKQRKQGERLEG